MEILTNLQKQILNLFQELPDKEVFYLTGGTALSAFFLKHRKSHDLDFFTNIEELISPFSIKFEEVLKKYNLSVERKRGLHSFVELSVNSSQDSTLIHLAVDSPFRFEQTTPSSEFPRLKVDSLIDIATNKLLALFGRAALRDFIDIYFLIKEKYVGKNELIEKAYQKDPGFDLYWFGIALDRINDFSQEFTDMHLLIKPCTMEELTDFFNVWKKEISKEIITDRE